MLRPRVGPWLAAATATSGLLWACAAPDAAALTGEPTTRASDPRRDAGGSAAPDDRGPLPATEAGAPDGGPVFSAGAITVCPSGCDHTVPSMALAAAKSGAVIEIQAGAYDDCLAIRLDQVTIRGVGGFAHLHGKLCDEKGIIVTYGRDTRLENLELSDFRSADFGGAAVRHDASGTNLTLQNLFVHDGHFGLLASSTGDAVAIVASTFRRVGAARPDGEISVPVFVTGAQTLSIDSSRFLDGVGGASMIKSRARSTTIACSVIANLDGPDSYSVDLQTGNDFSLLDSVVAQSAVTENKTIIAYGTVSFDRATAKSFTMTGNTILNDASGGTFINLANGVPAAFTVSGNTFIGRGTVLAGGGQLGANQILATRPATLGAYPALPSPGVCP